MKGIFSLVNDAVILSASDQLQSAASG